MKAIRDNFYEARDILEQFISSEENLNAIEQAGNLLVKALQNGKKIISCGNGGSMSDAMHFAEELTGRFREDRKPFPAMAISDPTHLSCTSNDYGYDHVFSRYVEAFGNAGDVLLGISTSGNSGNIVKAVEVARERNMKVITLTGKDGGKLSRMADVEIRAPRSAYSDRAQEIHIKVIHSLIHFIELKLGNVK
ncbi:MAG: D-sedoheptulose 7-phosphate isomerase [Bacteroidales bacterium]|nr:D-sedoheptulose 7-phosphate isomerase [Bacteroidales bacterium]MBS3774380.1 D-sedoheptulose 7-phosphate isomerase [Bacteroidales bacterium]